MSLTGAIVTYAVLWFVCLLPILSMGVPTQIEKGSVVPGTPGGAPAAISIRRKFLWASLLAAAVWAVIFVVLEYQLITLDDLDFMMPGALKSGA